MLTISFSGYSPIVRFLDSGESLEGSPEAESNSDHIQESSESLQIQEDILEQVSITNHLLAGVILFLGIIVGCICMSHFFNRFRSH